MEPQGVPVHRKNTTVQGNELIDLRRLWIVSVPIVTERFHLTPNRQKINLLAPQLLGLT